MGHKIHPDIFRLGISKDWQYQLRDPLLANVFIYKTVKKLFLQYSAPYVSYTIRRDVNPRKFTPQQHKIRMIPNPFLRNALVFSHLNISYTPSLLLGIFLFDIGAERRRIKERLREKSFYYLSGAFSYEMRRAYNFFRKYMYMPAPAKYSRKAYTWKRYVQFYRNNLGGSALKPKQIITKLIAKAKRSHPKLFRHKRKSERTANLEPYLTRHVPYKYHSAWLINNYLVIPRYIYRRKRLTDLKILCFLLRYIKCYNYKNSKKRLYFLNLLYNSVTSCLLLLRVDKITRLRAKKFQTVYHKLIYLQSMLFLQLTRFKSIYLRYNKKLFQSRLLLYNLYAKILLFTIRKTAFIPNDRQLIVKFFALHNRNLSAQFLVNYIIIKLGQYFYLNSIINPIIYRYKRLNVINGFRIIISGRLTRKERAAYIVKSHKSMPLATAKVKIDYASDFKIMRFGVVGIKVYLLCSSDIPYYYFFEFKNKL